MTQPQPLAPGWSGADPASLHDDLPCGWLRAELGGALLQSNRPLRTLLGWPDEAQHQDLPVSLNLLMAPGGRVLFQSYLLPLLRLHGRIEEFALELRHRQGGTVPVMLYGHMDTGAGTTFSLVCVPMQERRRLEDELLRIKRAADLAPGVIFQAVAHDDGRVTMPYASEALRSHYRLAPQTLQRSLDAWLHCLHPDDRQPLLQHFAGLSGVAGAQRAWRLEVRVPQPDGGVQWHEVHAVARTAALGPLVWHGYIADVTTRRALETALRDKVAAEQASQAKSAFMARVSHELRTPLNAILGFAQLMRTQDADRLSAEQQRRLATIDHAGRDLLQLINEVLDISRAEQGQVAVDLAPLPLAPALSRAMGLLELQAQAQGVHLHLAKVPAQAWVCADTQRLHEVLVNLLANAIKYNRRGGVVMVDVRAEAAGWRLDVVDSGAGLTNEQLAHLFEPFNRLGAERSGIEGAGLGLTISQRLVQLMGGRLEASSRLGLGSTFSIWLPAATALSEGGASGPPVAEPAPTGGLGRPVPRQPLAEPAEPAAPVTPPRSRVLLVEDHPVNALLMAAMLRQRPAIELVTVASGAALWAHLTHPSLPRPDLVLLDLHLPDGSGLAWLERLRQHPAGQGLRVVVVTASATPEERAGAQALGVLDYWLKPLDLALTLQRLDLHLVR
ncbi:MAG: ATP-binding protein [Rubrivivax sp.]